MGDKERKEGREGEKERETEKGKSRGWGGGERGEEVPESKEGKMEGRGVKGREAVSVEADLQMNLLASFPLFFLLSL